MQVAPSNDWLASGLERRFDVNKRGRFFAVKSILANAISGYTQVQRSVPSHRRISGSAEFWPAAENPPKNTAAENAAEI